MPPAVEVAHRRREKQARGINPPLRQRLEPGADGEQFPANRARAGVQLTRSHQAAHEVFFHQQIRIERQHPLRPGAPDPLVLRRREPHVAPVPDDPYAATEFVQDRPGAVVRGVIHHHDGRLDALLRHYCVQTAPDVTAAVECDNGYAYGGFRHWLGVVQFKDPRATNPTTLNPGAKKIFLKMV